MKQKQFFKINHGVLKNQKFNEVLSNLGHKDIKNLKVVNRINVEDTITKEKSYVYKLTFFDNPVCFNMQGVPDLFLANHNNSIKLFASSKY